MLIMIQGLNVNMDAAFRPLQVYLQVCLFVFYNFYLSFVMGVFYPNAMSSQL